MENRKNIGLTSAALRNLAMVIMLIDHVGAVLLPQVGWLRAVGRLAFPIFAFLIGEGYRHTSDLKRYMGRLLLFALISEIPFNLLVSGSIRDCDHQNVLFTLLLGLMAIAGIEKGKGCQEAMQSWLLQVGTPLLCIMAAGMLNTDYNWIGVVMVLGFHLFRNRKLPQLILMIYLNQFCIQGRTFTLLGITLQLQAIAVLALLLIWCYRGEKGRGWNMGYWFYPAHMLVLAALSMLIK